MVVGGRHAALQSGYIRDSYNTEALLDGNIFLPRKIFKWEKNNLPKLA